MTNDVSALFDSRFLRSYARSKLARDPVYGAVASRLPDLPLLDIGCGVGLLALSLRHCGFSAPILGIDHDGKKIAAAVKAAEGAMCDARFMVADAREPIAFQGSVAMLDVLHYFDEEEQRRILRNAVACVAPGGVVIIRDAIRDRSWRYRATYIEETFARSIGWLRGERLNFPTRDVILDSFDGFRSEVTPMWGRTPFNNYLFVFERSSYASAASSGITKR